MQKFIIRTADGYYKGNGFTKLPLEAMRFDTRNEAAKRCRLRSDWHVEDIFVPSSPSVYQFEQIHTVERTTMKNFIAVLFMIAFISLQGCGGGSTTMKLPPTPPPPTPIVTSVSVSPANPTISTNATQQFSATVVGTGAFSQNVTWGVTGLGTISATGLYTASGTAGTAFVTATSTEDTSIVGTANITVTAPPPSTNSMPGWYGMIGNLPVDFDLTATGNTLTSGYVLQITSSTPNGGPFTDTPCPNFYLNESSDPIPAGSFSGSYAGPVIANQQAPNYLSLTQMTGTINGQNITLQYPSQSVTLTGVLGTNGQQATITGTFTTPGANPCLGATSGNFSFTQSTSVRGTYAGVYTPPGSIYSNGVPPYTEESTPVPLTLTPTSLVYPLNSTSTRTFGMSIETAGRYFHMWSAHSSNSANVPFDLIAWGLVIKGTAQIQVTLDSIQQPSYTGPVTSAFFPEYLYPGTSNAVEQSTPTTFTPQP